MFTRMSHLRMQQFKFSANRLRMHMGADVQV